MKTKTTHAYEVAFRVTVDDAGRGREAFERQARHNVERLVSETERESAVAYMLKRYDEVAELFDPYNGGATARKLPEQQTVAEPLETAAITAARFLALVDHHDIDWNIQWFWKGRSKNGRLVLREKPGGPAIFVREYERNSSLWTGSDNYLAKGMRTGSPRHLAILDALAFLKTLP